MKKRIISIMTFLAVVGVLAGCGKAEESLQDMKVEKYVTLGEYKGIEVTVDPIAVSDAEVEELVVAAYSSSVTVENGGITDRAVAVGDTANIDYEGKKDDVAFEGGTAAGQNLTIGSGQFIPGFEDGLVGVMPGETVDLNLTFPENYGNELAGADVVFTVTVNFIVPTEMKDEVVASMGIEGVTTVEGLRQYAYDYLYAQEEYNYSASVENAVFNAFMNSCVFEELPESFVNGYREVANESINLQAQSYGMDAESFVSAAYQMTLEQFLSEYSIEGAKQDIALQAVANMEGLNMTDEEAETAMQEAATAAGYTSVEEFLGDTSKETYRDYLVCQRAYEFIVDNSVVNN